MRDSRLYMALLLALLMKPYAAPSSYGYQLPGYQRNLVAVLL
jgi:hypothetical protein